MCCVVESEVERLRKRRRLLALSLVKAERIIPSQNKTRSLPFAFFSLREQNMKLSDLFTKQNDKPVSFQFFSPP